MAAFYFHFEGQFYHALGDISKNNGQITCDLKTIINSSSLEPAKLKGFEPGPVLNNDLALSKAINKGLLEYVKNHPLDHG